MQKALQDIGLTKGEVKVYLALTNLGTTQTGPLIKKSGVSSSKVYKILDRLEKKGLVGYIVKKKTKHFSATDPKRILDFLEQKEKETQQKKENFKKILPALEQAREAAKKKTDATLFSGFKATTNMFKNMLDELSCNDTYLVIGGGYGDSIPGLEAFFTKFHNLRAKKNIKLKMLANHNKKDTLVPTTYKKAKIRFLPEYLLTNMEVVLYKKKAFITIWTKEPYSFLLESEEAKKGFQKYFDSFWKVAQPACKSKQQN